MSNQHNFYDQCVWYMDRVKKMHVFGLFATLKWNNASLLDDMVMETNDMADHYLKQTWLSQVLPDEEKVTKLLYTFEALHSCLASLP